MSKRAGPTFQVFRTEIPSYVPAYIRTIMDVRYMKEGMRKVRERKSSIIGEEVDVMAAKDHA